MNILFIIQVVYEINTDFKNGFKHAWTVILSVLLRQFQMNAVRHNEEVEHNVKRECLFVNIILIDTSHGDQSGL